MDKEKQELYLPEIFLETRNRDFGDVYGEFDYMLTSGMKRKYLILQMN